MRTFRDIPIKQKLVIIIMVTTTAALLLAASASSSSDSILFRGYLQRDLSALAQIIADNSTAALAFNDPEVGGRDAGRAARQAPRGERVHLPAGWNRCSPDTRVRARLPHVPRPMEHDELRFRRRRLTCLTRHSAERPPDRNPDAALRSR